MLVVLRGLERKGTEAKLILEMVEFEAGKRCVFFPLKKEKENEKDINCINDNRPDTHTILQHPYFWDSHKRLTFFQDVFARFEICRDPKYPRLLTLETEATEVVGNDWHARLDKVFVENLGKMKGRTCRIC